jgi:hypothetical protein
MNKKWSQAKTADEKDAIDLLPSFIHPFKAVSVSLPHLTPPPGPSTITVTLCKISKLTIE